MNAYMNIRIQVLANQARREMQQMGASVSQLQTQMAAANATTARGTAAQKTAFQSLSKWGNQVQWTGRQLEYNFTLPIALAGAAATKFALDNEAAMVRVEKVYDKGTLTTAGYNAEIEALKRNFEALSNVYGVAQKDVIAIAADFAAAGSSGAALARQTQLALKTMVLGEIDAATATKALIAIQAQYNFSSSELADTIARLNNVENQTGTTMSDLIVSLSKSAGVARAAGVDVQHLAAMTAALTPAAGSAAEAGNSLKTIMARLLSPTQQAAQILKEVGIQVDETAWKSADAGTRLEILSTRYESLSDAQKAVASSTLASNWQVSRFEVLMDAIAQKGDAAGNGMSYYWKALQAASDQTKDAAGRIQYLTTMQNELNAVLDSNPHKVKQVGVMLQNSMTRVIQPLLPVIMGMAQTLGTLAEKLGNVDPALIKLVASGLLFIAVLGPLARYAGSFGTLIGILGRGFGALTGVLGGAATGMFTFGASARKAAADQAILARANAISAAAAEANAIAQAKAVLAAHADASLPTRVNPDTGDVEVDRRNKFRRTLSQMGKDISKGSPVGMWSKMWARMNAVFLVFRTSFFTQLGVMRLYTIMSFQNMWLGAVARTKAGVTVISTWVSKNLVSSFMGSMLILRTALAARWAELWLALSTQVFWHTALMKATLARHWATIVALYTTGRTAVVTRMAAMWAALTAMSTGGSVLAAMRLMWTRALLFAGVGMVGIRAFVTTQWIALSTAMSAVWTKAWVALVRIQTAGSAAMAAVHRLFSRGFIGAFMYLGAILPQLMMQIRAAVATAWYGMLLFMNRVINPVGMAIGKTWAAMMAGLGAIMGAGMNAMKTIWVAGTTGLASLVSLAGGLLGRVWGAAVFQMNRIWASVLFAMRVGWMAFIAFLSSPAAIFGAFKRIGAVMAAGGRGILGVLTALRTAVIAVLTSPWVIAIAAVIGLIVIFRDQLRQVWNNIVKYFSDANNGIIGAFNKLPQGVQNAIMAVVNIVKTAALKVYEWFSYLNPFAHHSPSLVENVNNGMAAVRKGFGTLVQVQAPIMQAYVGIKKLKDAAGSLVGSLEALKRANDRKNIEAVDPGLLPAYDNLVRILGPLKDKSNALEDAVTGQERAVKTLSLALDDSNDALDRQKKVMDNLQSIASGYKEQIDGLKDAISNFASTQITGMGAAEDAIWDNEMAQKRLRLEMLKMGQEAGSSYDDIRSKIASLQGEIENLTGNREALRSAGAGSDILDFYDQQINALQGQKKALAQAGAPVEKLQSELEKLQTQAEIMDLEKSLKFDPLTRQIEKAANSMQELPFNEIMQGIRTNQAALVPLESQYAAVNSQIAAQQGVIDRAQASHDALQATYDAENLKLTVLKQSYDDIAESVRDVEAALGDMASAASEAIQMAKDGTGYVSPALQNFRDAEGGNFADVSGSGMLGREGTDAQNLADIEAMTAELENQLGGAFGDFDMWAPFKEMWNGFVNWWNQNVVPWFAPIGEFFTTIFDGVDFGSVFGDMFGDGLGGIDWAGMWSSAWEEIKSTISTIWQFGQLIWDLLGPDFQNTINNVTLWFDELWRVIKDMWEDVKDRAEPFMEALGNLWDIIKTVGLVVIGALIMALENVWSIFNAVLEPAIHMVIGVLENLWDIVMGVVDVFIGLFTLDFKTFFNGLGEILGGIVGILWDVIVGIGSMIWGAIQGLATGVWDNMVWLAGMLWEGLGEGISNGYNAVKDWFSDVINGIIDWVKDLFGVHSPSTVFADIGMFLLEGLMNGLESLWNTVTNFFGDLLRTIGEVFRSVWDATLGPIFTLITDNWDKLGRAFDWSWNNVIKPAWNAFKDAIQWVWDHTLGPVFDAISDKWDLLGEAFKWTYDTFIKPIIDAFKTAVEGVKSAFDTVVGGIQTAWDTIKGIMATPINFVINTVLNNGLIKGFNAVVGFFGLDSWKINNLDPIPGYAKGGHVDGYSKTDRADNIRANLTAGEFVQPVRAVDRYGKPFMEAIRTGKFPVEAARNYADGGYVDLFNAVKAQFPQARLNDGYRPGARDWHGRGKAVDLGKMGVAGGTGNSYMAAMNQWIYDNKKAATTELIYDGSGDNRRDVKNGRDWQYGRSLELQHMNHVHLAAQNVNDWIRSGGGAGFAGLTASSSGDIRPSWWSDPIGYIKSQYESFLNQVPGSGKVVDWVKKAPGRLVDNIKDWLLDKINPLGWFGGDEEMSGVKPLNGGQSEIRALVKSIAAQRGWDEGPQWQALSAIINKESSWNPNAQNPTSTAYGLFQFLNSTWASTGYAKSSSPNIQTMAGLQYIASRYGTPNAAWQFHNRNNWYDQGGLLQSGAAGFNGSGKPERVLDPSQTQAFDRLIRILDGDADQAMSKTFSAIVEDFAPSARAMEEAMLRANAEMRATESRLNSEMGGDVTVNNTTINIYGDLSFPNIDNGDDAKTFISNLSDLASGR